MTTPNTYTPTDAEKKDNARPVFYFAPLKFWDYLFIGIYILISIGIWYYFTHASDYDRRHILSGYTLCTHLYLYFFNYRSLRNLTVYFIWLFIAAIHFCLYLHLKDSAILFLARDDEAIGFRNTIIFLLLFQVLRLISLKTQGKELVAPRKGGRMDIFDERKFGPVDLILFLVYFAVFIVLDVLPSKT